MPTIRIPLLLTWSGVSGSPGANVFHGRVLSDDALGNADLDGLSAMLEDFYTSISGLYCSDLTIRFEGEATGVGDDVGQIYSSPSWLVTGTNGVDHLASVLQMQVRWAAATGGANGRGRTYIGPLATGTHEANGTPDESERTTLQDAADALVEASDSFANGALGVYSRVEDTFRDFVSANVPNKFAILRSRRD